MNGLVTSYAGITEDGVVGGVNVQHHFYTRAFLLHALHQKTVYSIIV